MPEAVILGMIVMTMIMVQINPYGALGYSVIMASWKPTDFETFINYTMVSIAVLLLSTLIWKSRSGSK